MSDNEDKKMPKVRNRPNLFKRTYLIIPNMQWNFILQLLLAGLVVIGVFYYFDLVVFKELLNGPEPLATDQLPDITINHLEFKAKLDRLFIYKTVFFFIVLTMWGAYFTNKVAGPVYRLKQSLLQYKERGEAKKIVLRQGDYFHELAELVNEIAVKEEK